MGRPQIMDCFEANAVKHLNGDRLRNLKVEQIKNLSPHAASFLTKDLLMPYTDVKLRRAIRSAVGESEKLKAELMKIENDMATKDKDREETTDRDSKIGETSTNEDNSSTTTSYPSNGELSSETSVEIESTTPSRSSGETGAVIGENGPQPSSAHQ